MPDIVNFEYDIPADINGIDIGSQQIIDPGAGQDPGYNAILQSYGELLKNRPTWSKQSILNQPYKTRLDDTLRFTDPDIGFNPFDDRLEYKYADAHPVQTFGNNLVQFGARFLGAATESIATIPLLLAGESLYDNELTNSINQWFDDLETSHPTFTSEYEENHPFLKYLAIWNPKAFGGAWGGAINNLGYTAGAFAGSYLTMQPLNWIGNAFKLTKLFGSFGRAMATDAKAVQQQSMALARIESGITNAEGAVIRTGAAAEEQALVRQGQRLLPGSTSAEGAAAKAGGLGDDFMLAEGTGMAPQTLPNISKNIAAKSVNNLDKSLNILNTIAKVRDWSKYNIALLNAATAEGSFEANNVMRYGKDNLAQKFYEVYGRSPVGDELRELENIVQTSADFTMASNVALLYLSNRLSWGTLFKPTRLAQREVVDGTIRNVSKKSLQQNAKTGLYEVVSRTPETRIGKLLLNLSRPGRFMATNIGEAVEEGSQFIVSESALDYANRRYDASHRNEVADYMKSFYHGLNKTFTTNEGWDNIIGGFVGGILGGVVRNRIEKARGIENSALKRLQQQAELMNSANLTGLFEHKVQEAAANVSLAKDHKKALEAGDVFKANTLKHEMLFNYVSSAVKANRFDMRIDELEAAKGITDEEFQKMWGLEYNPENGQSAADYLSGVIEKAKAIKRDIDKVHRLWGSNPFNPKTQSGDYLAYDSYKDQLALNLSKSREFQARMKSVQADLKSLMPNIDVQRALEMTSLQGIRGMLTRLQNTMNELAKQQSQLQDNPELVKDIISKRQKLKELFDELQPQVLEGFEAKKFVNTLEKLYKYYSGLDDTNNEYIDDRKRIGEANHIYLEAENNEKRSNDELADALEQLQDIRQLAAANFASLRYYDYLQNDIGRREFTDRIKEMIQKNMESIVTDENGKVLTEKEVEEQVEEEVRFDVAPEKDTEETTAAERETLRRAAKKKVNGQDLSDDEKATAEAKPNAYTREVKIQQTTKEETAKRTGKSKKTATAEEAEQTSDLGNNQFRGIEPRQVFGLFSQDKNQIPYRTQLYNAIFKSGINNVLRHLTAKLLPKYDEARETVYTKIPGTNLYRSSFNENLTIYHQGNAVGILRPPDSVWLDNEGKRSVYDMTLAEYSYYTGNDPTTYNDFMAGIRAYQNRYNEMRAELQRRILSDHKTELEIIGFLKGLNNIQGIDAWPGASDYVKQHVGDNAELKGIREYVNKREREILEAQDHAKFDINDILVYFDPTIGIGSRAQSNDPRKDTLLRDLNYKPEGTVLISMVDTIVVENGVQRSVKTTEPVIVNEAELTDKQFIDVQHFINDNLAFLRKNFHRYALILPVNGKYILQGVVAARNAETTASQRDQFFQSVKNAAAGMHDSEQLNILSGEINETYFLANEERAVKQSFTTIVFTPEGDFVLRINNPSMRAYKEIVINRKEIQNMKNFDELMTRVQAAVYATEIKDATFKKLQIIFSGDSLKHQLPTDEKIGKLEELNDKLKLATTADVWKNYTIYFNPRGGTAQTGPQPTEPAGPQPAAPTQPTAPVTPTEPTATTESVQPTEPVTQTEEPTQPQKPSARQNRIETIVDMLGKGFLKIKTNIVNTTNDLLDKVREITGTDPDADIRYAKRKSLIIDRLIETNAPIEAINAEIAAANHLTITAKTLPDGIKFYNKGYLILPNVETLPENVEFRTGHNMEHALEMPRLKTFPASTVFNHKGALKVPSLEEIPADFTFSQKGSVFVGGVTTQFGLTDEEIEERYEIVEELFTDENTGEQRLIPVSRLRPEFQTFEKHPLKIGDNVSFLNKGLVVDDFIDLKIGKNVFFKNGEYDLKMLKYGAKFGKNVTFYGNADNIPKDFIFTGKRVRINGGTLREDVKFRNVDHLQIHPDVIEGDRIFTAKDRVSIRGKINYFVIVNAPIIDVGDPGTDLSKMTLNATETIHLSHTIIPNGHAFRGDYKVDLMMSTSIGDHVTFENRGDVIIGADTPIGEGVRFYNVGEVRTHTRLPESARLGENTALRDFSERLANQQGGVTIIEELPKDISTDLTTTATAALSGNKRFRDSFTHSYEYQEGRSVPGYVLDAPGDPFKIEINDRSSEFPDDLYELFSFHGSSNQRPIGWIGGKVDGDVVYITEAQSDLLQNTYMLSKNWQEKNFLNKALLSKKYPTLKQIHKRVEELAADAKKNNRSIREEALAQGELTAEQFPADFTYVDKFYGKEISKELATKKSAIENRYSGWYYTFLSTAITEAAKRGKTTIRIPTSDYYRKSVKTATHISEIYDKMGQQYPHTIVTTKASSRKNAPTPTWYEIKIADIYQNINPLAYNTADLIMKAAISAWVKTMKQYNPDLDSDAGLAKDYLPQLKDLKEVKAYLTSPEGQRHLGEIERWIDENFSEEKPTQDVADTTDEGGVLVDPEGNEIEDEYEESEIDKLVKDSLKGDNYIHAGLDTDFLLDELSEALGRKDMDRVAVIKQLLAEINNIANKDIKFSYNDQGQIEGFTYNGEIFLTRDALSFDTTFEEAGHLWINWAEQNRPDLYRAGIDKIQGTKYVDDVLNSEFYVREAFKFGPAGSEGFNKYIHEEALAKAIRDGGVRIADKNKKRSFQTWLDSLWEALKELFGLHEMSLQEVSILTMEQFAERVAADLLNPNANQTQQARPDEPLSAAAQILMEKVNAGKIKGLYAEEARRNPEGLVRDIARQAQNLKPDFTPANDGREDASREAAEETFGNSVVEAAVAAYPAQIAEQQSTENVPDQPTEDVIEPPQEPVSGDKYVKYTELGETKYARVVEAGDFVTRLEHAGQEFDKLTEKLQPASQEEYQKSLPEAPTPILDAKYKSGDRVTYGQDGDTYTITGVRKIDRVRAAKDERELPTGEVDIVYTTAEGADILESGITGKARVTPVVEKQQIRQEHQRRLRILTRMAERFHNLFPQIKYDIGYFDFNAPARFYKGVVQINVGFENKLSPESIKERRTREGDIFLKRETIAHEFMHPFVLALQQSNPALYNSLVAELIKTQPEIMAEVDKLIREGTYTEAERQNEALVIYLGRSITKAFDKNGVLREDYVADRKKSLIKRFAQWLSDLFDYIMGRKKPPTLDEFVHRANSDTSTRRNTLRSQINSFPAIQELYNKKYKSDLDKTVKFIKNEYEKIGFEVFAEKYGITDQSALDKFLNNVIDYTEQKSTGKFTFAIRDNENHGVEFEESEDSVKVFIDPSLPITSANVLEIYGNRITDNALAEEYKEIVRRNFYRRGDYERRETIGVKDINPFMRLEDVSDYLITQLSEDKNISIEYDNNELTAIDQLEAYMELTEESALKDRRKIISRLAALQDIANRRLNSETLNLQYNILNRLNLDETDTDFILAYIEQGVGAINLAWRKYNELRQDLDDKPNLTRAKLNRLNKELEVIKQLVSMYDDVTTLYNNYGEVFDEDQLGNFRKATVYVDRIKYSIANTAAELATEWLYPYIEKNNEYLAKQGYTDPKYTVTRDEFKNNLLYGTNKDVGYLTFQLGALVTSRDPVNAAFANTVTDALHANHVHINNEVDDYTTEYQNWLKRTGISAQNDKAQVDYYNKHYYRKAKIWTIVEYDQVDNKPIYGYLEKTALHQEYKYDEIDDAVRKFRKSLPEPKTGDEWEEQNKKVGEYHKSIIEKFRNPEYDKLKGDQYFKHIEKTYNEHNKKYGKDGLQYGIIPQVYRANLITDIATKFRNVFKEGDLKQKARLLKENLSDKLANLHEDVNDINLDGTTYRTLNKSLTNFKAEDKIEHNLQVSMTHFIIDSSRYAALKEIQFNAENLRMLIEGNTKFGVLERKIGAEDLLGQIRDQRSMEAAKRKLKQLENQKAVGDPAFDQKEYDRLKEKIAKGIKPRSVWDRFLPKLKAGNTQRLNTQLSEMLNDVFYGETEHEAGVKILGQYVNINKVANALGFYVSINSMAFNRVAAVANVLQGNTQMWIEAFGGKHYGKKDVAWATAHYGQNAPKYMADMLTPIHSKDTQLALKFDAIQGEFEDEYGIKVSGNVMRRMLRPGSLFFMTKLGEHQIQMTGMLALMHNTKVKTKSGETINLYDAYVKDANGRYDLRKDVDISDEDLTRFKRTLHGINRTLNGNYNELHKGHLQRTWYGKQLLRFRKWLYEGARARWSGERVDYEKNTVEQGYLNYFFKDYMFGAIQQRQLDLVKRYRNLTPDQKYRVNKATAELAFYVLLTAVALALGGDEEKRQNLTEAEKMVLVFALRLRGDMGTYHLEAPAEAARMFENPAASVSVLKKMLDFAIQLRDPNEVYQRDYGIYKKGDSMLEAKFKRLIPIWNKAEIDWDNYLKYYSLIEKDIK